MTLVMHRDGFGSWGPGPCRVTGRQKSWRRFNIAGEKRAYIDTHAD